MTPTLATHLHAARLELARGLPMVVQAPARDGQAQPWRRGLCLGRDLVADAWVVETTGLPERVRREGDGWVRLGLDDDAPSYRRAKREAAKANRLPPPESAVWVVEGPLGWVLPDVDTLAGRRHVLDVAHERGMDLPLDSWAPGCLRTWPRWRRGSPVRLPTGTRHTQARCSALPPCVTVLSFLHQGGGRAGATRSTP